MLALFPIAVADPVAIWVEEPLMAVLTAAFVPLLASAVPMLKTSTTWLISAVAVPVSTVAACCLMAVWS